MNEPDAASNAPLLVHWDPSSDTIIAIATVLGFIGIYTANHFISLDHGLVHLLLFVVCGSLFLTVGFPAWYMLRLRGKKLQDLGITCNHWIAALGLSLLLALYYLPQLLALAANYRLNQMVPQLVYNGINLWEPFFLFGWLQLRFERAFGVLPAVLLTALCFASYHAPALGLADARTIFMAGVLFATVFRLTSNLLSMIPLTWMVASTIGTLSGHMAFGWVIVVTYVMVLAIQVAMIAWFASGSTTALDRRAVTI
jgi:membrane protease YdiL (CAAX protease family)